MKIRIEVRMAGGGRESELFSSEEDGFTDGAQSEIGRSGMSEEILRGVRRAVRSSIRNLAIKTR